MSVFIALAIEFFKTGLFAIGGGLATLPFLYQIAEKYDWLDVGLMSDMIAVSESTPGPIGVNMATYAGFNAGMSMGSVWFGIFGGLTATLSLVFPSLVICIIVYKFLERFKESTLVNNAFEGLRPAVCGLIAAACLAVFREACLDMELYEATKNILSLVNPKAIIVFVVFFILTRVKKLHPIFYIIPGALVGILLRLD